MNLDMNRVEVQPKVRKRSFWTNQRRESAVGLMFVAPEFLGILLLGVFPLLFSLYLSFTEWNLVGGVKAIHFVGLDNFKGLLTDTKLYLALKNNALYSLVTVPIGMALGLVLAVIINSVVYLKEYFKVVFFIPYIATGVAVATVFTALFHPSKGPVNHLLMSLGISDPPKWLGSTDFALWAIIIVAVWMNIGYNIVIYMAGLTNIPEDLYESASIDGANWFQKLLSITLPLLGPTTFFLSITSIVASFKVFDLIAFLTEGGPNNSTNVLVYYIYEEGFKNFRMGYASALSWVLFLIISVVTAITWRIQKKQF
ncbi:carbohydrate ABC transporter permease [Paenibacillus sp. Soil787]|uniref:carbohydrate ABC transporter permease n=1 Tax=Paenibacillus sp. Soil787 TaxID=1736411 RepID=UPI0006F77132|nr:sugar ABC transporter permease [Paenibacillus sp. Soil787]KRF44203.1 sugar ABC transporter permease [Paenibacillus sp. Soil787]